ncbi:MAG: hypothetical protein Q7U53_01450 [Anaerolineaceae bacterium]|nr:hypothetical protein [Anaerolineaceae bacterium]
MLVKNRLTYLSMVGIILLITIACNIPSSPPVDDLISPPPGQVLPEAQVVVTPKPDPEPDPGPNPVANPIPLLKPTGDELKSAKSYFNQEQNVLVSVFELENVNTKYALTDIYTLVHAFDANGTELKTATKFIDFLLPGEKTMIVSDLWLAEGEVTDSVTIDWDFGLSENVYAESPLQTHSPRVFYNESLEAYSITGAISNSSPSTYLEFQVNAVGFNNAGEIIGGGYTFITHIPGNNKVGFRLPGYFEEEPASIEFFPSKSLMTIDDDTSALHQNLEIVESNYIRYQSEMEGGFIIKNVGNQVINRFDTYLTFYDQDGSTCEVSISTGNLIFPGETAGISSFSPYLPQGCNFGEYELIIIPIESSGHELSNNPLKTENVQYVPGSFPTVTMTIINTFSKSINDAVVSVLLFNNQDEIISGGLTYVDTIPANGTVEASVQVTSIGEEAPARIDAYPALTTWTTIGD